MKDCEWGAQGAAATADGSDARDMSTLLLPEIGNVSQRTNSGTRIGFLTPNCIDDSSLRACKDRLTRSLSHPMIGFKQGVIQERGYRAEIVGA
jgi:hypothetical protein